MTRLITEGNPEPLPKLHPAFGTYRQCKNCSAIFEIDNLEDITRASSLEPYSWGDVRCPCCHHWVHLTPPAKPTPQTPWIIDWVTIFLILALAVIILVTT